jgi:hypothetical protein
LYSPETFAKSPPAEGRLKLPRYADVAELVDAQR